MFRNCAVSIIDVNLVEKFMIFRIFLRHFDEGRGLMLLQCYGAITIKKMIANERLGKIGRAYEMVSFSKSRCRLFFSDGLVKMGRRYRSSKYSIRSCTSQSGPIH